MHVHHDGHHATYVKSLSETLKGHAEFLNMDVEDLLKSLDKVPEDIRTKVKNNAGGHYHHSLLWQMMRNKSKGLPEGSLLEAINNTFGDFNNFREKLNQSVLGLFGSGWTWLVVSDGKLEIINTPNQDSPISLGQSPILTIDVWEHAYYLKYKNKRADYIQS